MPVLQLGQPRFDIWRGQGFFLLATASRLALRVKQPGHEADYSPPSGTVVKNTQN